MMKKNKGQHVEGMFQGAPASSFEKAEALRNKMTEAESLLWERLKGKKLNGLKFRREHPIHLYIADFYCHQLKLVIEVDGAYHLEEKQKKKDAERTKDLEYHGVKVLRFRNEEILNNIEGVLKKILSFSNSFPQP